MAPYRTEGRPAAETAVAPRVAVRPDVVTRPQDNLLITRKGPALSVETTGPRKIAVGRESVYGVTLVNSGEVAAEEVVVFVNLPAWADVVAAEVSTGATQAAAAPGEPAKPFQWKVGPLAANGKERLTLRIIPRESRPFDLAVRWDYKPVASQAMIEVQEPKVVMRLEGPREVHYGRREVFTLKLANTGTGDAENLVVALTPIGAGDNQPVSQKIGVLAAGEEKSIEVELTARQSGDLQIQVEARGDGNIHAQLAEKVLVRRAGLQVDVEGPQMQYVGSVSSYKLRVHNPGSAPARNIKLTVAIPPGAKYLAGIENATLAANGTRLQWSVDALNPGVEQVFVDEVQPGPAGREQGRSEHRGRGRTERHRRDDHARGSPGRPGAWKSRIRPGRYPSGKKRCTNCGSATAARRARGRGSGRLLLARRRAGVDRRRPGPPGPGASRLPADPVAGPRRRHGDEGPRQGRRGRQPRLPHRSLLQAAGHAPGQRADHALLPGRLGPATSLAARAGNAAVGDRRLCFSITT